MASDKMLSTLYYTDGNQVTITGSGFMVRNKFYELARITRHRVSIITPPRTPSLTLTVLGIVAFLCGALNLIPSSWEKNIHIMGVPFLINSVVMVAGVVLLLLGVFLLSSHEKYAVKVSTPEGEKVALVSDKREYVSQIVDALNHAHLDLMQKAQMKSRTE